MRSTLRRLADRLRPGTARRRALWYESVATGTRTESAVLRVEEQLAGLQAQVAELVAHPHDSRLDRLRELVTAVEHYQPLYGVAGIVEQPQRGSVDRARCLEAAMSPLPGQRVLDIGSSLGYMSFHLADRGARVTGWDLSPANVLVARAVGDLNGLPVTFEARSLSLDTVRAIAPGTFDSALILAVLHHVIHFEGLSTAQQIVAELLARVPVLYLELAVRDEDEELFWNETQPADPLEVLALVRDDVEVVELGHFPTHLSAVRRPLLRVSRRQVVQVAGRTYPYERVSFEAYDGAPVSASPGRRRYYFGTDHVVKEYRFDAQAPWNWQQVIGELAAYASVSEHRVHHALTLLDVDLSHERARMVVARAEGDLLDVAAPLPASDLVPVARDLLRTLGDLHAIGLHHNDVRSWNVLVGPAGAWLLDYGLTRPVATEDDHVAMAWALHAGRTGVRESYEVGKQDLPPLAPFVGTELEAVLRALAAGVRDAAELLALLPEAPPPAL